LVKGSLRIAAGIGALISVALFLIHLPVLALCVALLAILCLVSGLIADGLVAFSPFIDRVAMAGLANPRPGTHQSITKDDDLHRFETDLLRLINAERAKFAASQVSLHGTLLAEARARSLAISRRWRIFQVCLRQRLNNRGHYCSALEVMAVRTNTSPTEVLQQWLAKRRYRVAIRSGAFELGAVGVVREVGDHRYAVTLLLAQREGA
jgi:uncharacterized protein YkwD